MDEVPENAPQSARRKKDRRNKPKKEVAVADEAAEEVKLPAISKPKSMPEGRENLNVYGGRDGASDQLRKKLAKLENLLQEERQSRKADAREYVAKIKKLESKVDKVEKGAEELEEVAEKKAKRAAKMKEALTKVQEDQEGEAVQAKKKAVQLAKVLKEKEVESEKAIVKLQEQVETQSKKSKQYKQRLVKICTAIGEPLDLDAEDEDLPEAGKKVDKNGDGSKDGNVDGNAAGQPAKKLNVADRIVQMKDELEAAQHELRVANAANAQLRERSEQIEQQAEGLTQGQAGLAAEAAAAKEKAQHYLSKVTEVYAALGQTFEDEAPVEEAGEQGGTAAATSAAGKKGAQATPGKVGKPGQAGRAPGKPGAAAGKGGKADSKAAVSAMMDGEGLGPLAKLKSMRDEIIQLTGNLQSSEEAGAKAAEEAAKFKEVCLRAGAARHTAGKQWPTLTCTMHRCSALLLTAQWAERNADAHGGKVSGQGEAGL
ncbi:hypothetical protein CYMTET_25819 [Cymbomonas tetramitiformis]|uniref:Uncharacterized protein n=1 Tax=Cymbomonas tetramitiformis TaxID=36881 RepID=A0AAE0KYV2_9CHLO|nr:hypothetical protein CYMTET_25819 [Cymbomonas tetramitiformis]